MDLIPPTLSCVAGLALVLALAFVAVAVALFFVRWIEQMTEGLEDEAARE